MNTEQNIHSMIGKLIDWEYPNRSNGSGEKWKILDRTENEGLVEYLAKSPLGETQMIAPHWIKYIHE